MIAYLDATAIVKRYVAEAGSVEVADFVAEAAVVATVVISRAEVVAAFARASRVGIVTRDDAEAARTSFVAEWESFVRIQVTEVLVGRAATLAWDHGLRGYDSVHLAAAELWQDMLGERVTIATYDRQLGAAARADGLGTWPEREK